MDERDLFKEGSVALEALSETTNSDADSVVMNPACQPPKLLEALAYRGLRPPRTVPHSETDQIAKSKYDATAETDRQVIGRVAEIAEKRGVPRVHIALAWLLQKQPVTAPIVGATKITHLEDAVGALSVKLSEEEVVHLEDPYVPHRIVGHH